MAENIATTKPIKTKQDVIDFFDYLYVNRKLSFHPDDDFADYVNTETQEPSFTKDEIPLFNKRMEEAFTVLGDDIYEVGMDCLFKHYPEMKEAAKDKQLAALPKHQFADGGPLKSSFDMLNESMAYPTTKEGLKELEERRNLPKSIRTYKAGHVPTMCPVGTEIQTLIFKKGYFTKAAAIEWTKKHDFIGHEVDEKQGTYHIRQQSPEKFTEDSFRTINLRTGLKAVIGCPIKK